MRRFHVLLAGDDDQGALRALARLGRSLGIGRFRQGFRLLLALLGLLEQVPGVLDLLLGGVLRDASVTRGLSISPLFLGELSLRVASNN